MPVRQISQVIFAHSSHPEDDMMDNNNTKSVEKSPLKISLHSNGNTFTAVEMKDITDSGTYSSEGLDYKETDALYRHWAIGVAWASIVILLILAIASFILAAQTDSSAMFGFGFDALLDVGTSLVVVWRFYGSRGTIYSRMREHLANLFLGFLFLAAAISVAAKGIVYLMDGTKLHLNFWLFVVTGFGLVSCVILSCIKYYIGYQLNSIAVISDGYSSLACGVTALGIIISAIVFENKPEIYFLDSVLALAVAVFLAVYGIKLIVITMMEPEMSSAARSCCCQQSPCCQQYSDERQELTAIKGSIKSTDNVIRSG